MGALFLTGTDTGVGKTRIAAALVRAARLDGTDAVGMKPVAAGREPLAGGAGFADVEALRRASGLAPADDRRINPCGFDLPVSPHLAAAAEGRRVELAPIVAAYRALRTAHAAVVVEGVGGWSVPLSDALMQADLVRALELPVALVVGVRLGCINHALLSARAVTGDGCRLLGWIANHVDPALPRADGAVLAIGERIGAPLLAEVPHAATDAAIATALAPLLPMLAGR